MLDVIGAGATATSAVDWHRVWKTSDEKNKIDEHIDWIHSEGRKKPPVQTERHTEFATSWLNQTYLLLDRAFRAYWRNPTYLLAKLILNVVAGLFIGFTFYKAKGSIQGTQNKLFASISLHYSSNEIVDTIRSLSS
jgi:ATP-binding cassette subfamily G (WHITE) protein 2 (SNQ2)